VQPAGQKSGFSQVEPANTGVQFTNLLSKRLVAMNRVTENGSGVALGDVDGDGWCDIYLCGLENDNVLFKNLGDWTFRDVTAEAGLKMERQLSTGATFADVDGDGDLDLLVNSIGGGTRLLYNDGGGKFTEATEGRLVRRFGSMSMSLADIDLDGDLDLYVANYRTIVSKDEFPRLKVEARMQNGQVVLTPPGRFSALPAPGGNVEVFELGERDFLYVNDGSGKFAPVSWTTGNFLDEAGKQLTNSPVDWGLSVMMRDINEDGMIDILVCNDFVNSPDRIWIQEPGLRFRAAGLKSLRKVSLASMAVDVADFNRDGLDDLFFVEMLSRDHSFRQNHRDNLMKAMINRRIPDPLHRWEVPRNTLFLNRGDGTYAEIAELAGVDASEWSWGAVFLDVDLDGWEDLLIPTGHNHDVQDADVLRRLAGSTAPDSYEQRIRDLELFPQLKSPIIGFRNAGNGGDLKFHERQREWGLEIPGVANGLACADLDNDGDLDLVVNRLNDSALLLRNDSTHSRVAIRLAGNSPNTRGVGAKITVRGGPEGVVQTQRKIAGGRYLSSDDYVRVFAAGSGLMQIEVDWADGKKSIVHGVLPNSVNEISEGGARSAGEEARPDERPLFEDASDLLNHSDTDPVFNDYEHQPSLPYSLAGQGPALAWGDMDGDGREDLVIGASRGGRTAILRYDGNRFIPETNRITSRIHVEDQMGVLVAQSGTNKPLIISAISNYESAAKNGTAIEFSNGLTLNGELDCPGSIAMADLDGDGDLDLFVGGRVLPRRYPAAVTSRVYLNDSETFAFSAEWSKPFERIGLVSGAQFTDLNDDGRPDLVLALEWGPIRAYLNTGRTFNHENRELEAWRGWWTGVITGDFNNDGLTDIVAGNWGRNTPYQRFIKRPMRILHGDVDANGRYDAFIAIFSERVKDYVPFAGPEMLIEVLPGAAERISSYEQFAQMPMKTVLGGAEANTLEINTLDSMLFINRGNRFEAQPLPVEAQFAPVFGLAVADFNNDGNEDLVLGQNLFETRWEMGKLDSGRPLLLLGNGRGAFQTTSSKESGLFPDGQQRAVAVADFDKDGRPDVAVTQNRGETRLYRNRAERLGVRIQFEAGLENPNGVGVRYRVSKSSPVREVQAGGGWLSQNSTIHVVPRSRENTRMEVLWPGGRRTAVSIGTSGTELLVTPEGAKVLR
jgi:hypothetical protein